MLEAWKLRKAAHSGATDALYREKGEEARTIADEMNNSSSRATVLKVAGTLEAPGRALLDLFPPRHLLPTIRELQEAGPN
jgi:hypothetical protein